MKLLVVDDHALFRAGLKLLLTALDPAVVVIDVGDMASALRAAQQHGDFDIVLFDLCMPGASGFEAMASFRLAHMELPIVIVSGFADPRTVIEALERGAMGFIPKTAAPEILHDALKTVLGNGIYVPPVACEYRAPALSGADLSLKHISELGLTTRQLEVFRLIVQGRPNKLIARDLGVAESTIKSHVKPVLRALNVTSRVGAILEVSRRGLSLD